MEQELTGDVKEIVLFGPFAISPRFQRKGLGESLLRETLEEARRQGISQVVIMGEPNYYGKFGFIESNGRGIYLKDQDKSENLPFLLVLNLQKD